MIHLISHERYRMAELDDRSFDLGGLVKTGGLRRVHLQMLGWCRSALT